jgi:transcriptional regulator with XRE-family HTH domain/mannose-6-phosphate isomerase-like protein (cupin superfamily)
VDIGAGLRAERERQGVSLRVLAAQIGVTAGLISQIENGRTQPSVGTLYSLAERLGLSLDEMFGLSPRPSPPGPVRRRPPATPVASPGDKSTVSVRRAASRPSVPIATGLTWDVVLPTVAGNVDTVRVAYDPGASSAPDGQPVSHAGEEHAYLVDGELTLEIDGRRHVVRAGDSLSFDSTRPHRYVNETDVPAWGLWLNVNG